MTRPVASARSAMARLYSASISPEAVVRSSAASSPWSWSSRQRSPRKSRIAASRTSLKMALRDSAEAMRRPASSTVSKRSTSDRVAVFAASTSRAWASSRAKSAPSARRACRAVVTSSSALRPADLPADAAPGQQRLGVFEPSALPLAPRPGFRPDVRRAWRIGALHRRDEAGFAQGVRQVILKRAGDLQRFLAALLARCSRAVADVRASNSEVFSACRRKADASHGAEGRRRRS